MQTESLFDILNAMKSYIQPLRASLIILASLTGLLVAYVSASLFFPYITGKNFGFRILVELMLLLYIPLAYLAPEYRPQKSKGLLVYGCFVAVLLMADIFGVNPANSLWSNFERMEGFVTHIHLFVFTLIIASIKLTQVEWKKLFQFHLLANLLVVANSFGEISKISKALEEGGTPVQRISATLGNPAYLAIYCVFIIFFALLLLAQLKKHAPVEKTLYISSIALNLILIWQTQTRGTVLGLLAGAALGFVWYAWKKRDNKKLRNIAIAGIAAFFILVGSFVTFKESAFVQESPTLKRLADISLKEQTVRSRVMIWNMSLEGVKERPLLGWGQDNFVYVFAAHYNPEMFDQEQWFDRSHNVFFDWLIAAGVLGLAAYLALYGVLTYTVLRNKKEIFTTLEQSLILGLLVTYFVHNIIVFDNLVSYIVFFTLFAYVITRAEVPTGSKEKYQGKTNQGMFWTVALLSAVVMSAIFYHVVWKPYKLNTAIITMYKVANGGDSATIKAAAQSLGQSALYGPVEANEQLLALSGAVIRSDLAEADKQYIYSYTEKVFKENIAKDSLNPRPAALYASYLEGLGLNKESLTYYEYATTLTPRKVLLLGSYAQAAAAAGDAQTAERVADQAYGLAPRSADTAYLLASIKHFVGKDAEVPEIWAKTIEANNYSQEVLIKEILYYKKIGNPAQAQAAADRFAQRFPELKADIQTFLEQK
jgi:O-antigen ligase